MTALTYIEAVDHQYQLPHRRIDVAVDEATLRRLFDRTARQWEKLGETEPYWSVLTHDRYKLDNLTDAMLDEFMATGEESAGFLDGFLARAGLPRPKGLRVEFGCGVGRVTAALARRFEKVLAIDISPGNLAECRKVCERAGLFNIETLLMRRPEDIANVPAHQAMYSTIAFQHNTPPLQKHFLDGLLAKLADGGVVFFQTQTHADDYGFEAEGYLGSHLDPMDMHSLPMAEIFASLARHDVAALEVLPDYWTGRFGSHTFFGVRAAPERVEAPPRRRWWSFSGR